MQPHWNVFISSTSIDLPEYRDAITKAILSLGLFPDGMEHWPVGGENPVDLCRGKVAAARFFVGIYAHRYGWRPDPGGPSITEMEYDWAEGIPRLCFIMDAKRSWPSDRIEFEAKAELDAFKARIKKNHCGFFTTPDDLARQVTTALTAQLLKLGTSPGTSEVPVSAAEAWEAGAVIDKGDALAGVGRPDAEAQLTAAADAEYFAVRILREAMGDPEQPNTERVGEFFPEFWWDADQYHETLVILGEFLGGARGANQVARWLAGYSPEVALDVIERSGTGLTLDDVEPETRQALTAGANSRSTEPDLRGRAAAYRVLGWLGVDVRPGIGLPRGGPGKDDDYWVEIPAGLFLMGSTEEQVSVLKAQGYDGAERELPQREFALPGYWMARYPVTYAQYKAFVDDPEGGYAVDRYWTADGINRRGDKRQPERYWNDPRWHIPNHPVVGVTWYEAVAFCRWLTEKVGYEVRLPNEAEWEKAARGPDGRVYPWGDKYISGYANICETSGNVGPYYLQRTSAVGICAVENAAYGLRDMSGNVLEWCATKWGWKYDDGLEAMIPFNDLEGTAGRVLRGGSLDNSCSGASGACRYARYPIGRNYNVGFRVCASAPT